MKKTVLAFILMAMIIFTNTWLFAESVKINPAELKFTDIAKHWAEESINKVVDKEAFADKEGKFLPNKAITRSEFVTMLHKALDIKIAYFKAPDVTEYFDDVKNEDSYASALIDLVTTNIIDEKGHFNPNSSLTREEMMNYIMNAYRYKMGDNYRMIKILVKPFADDKEINPSYNGAVARAENMGITKRPVNNMFYPKHAATRAQAATVIDRLLMQLEKENIPVAIVASAELKEDSLNMKLTITNNLKTPIVINHSSGQKSDYKLLDANKNILYTWSADKSFIMALTETKIEPGQSVELNGEVEKALLDNMSQKPVYMKAYITGESKDFEVNPNGYEIEIKY